MEFFDDEDVDVITIGTDHTPAAQPLFPAFIAQFFPIWALFGEYVGLHMTLDRLFTGSLLFWITREEHLRQSTIDRLVVAHWAYLLLQETLPVTRRRPLEELDFVIWADNEFVDSVSRLCLGMRTRFRLVNAHFLEPANPNSLDLTPQERAMGYGVLMLRPDGSIPTNAQIAANVAEWLEGNKFLHSGRRNAQGGIIEDYQNAVVYLVIERALYRTLADRAEMLSSSMDLTSLPNSLSRKVPIGAIAFGGATAFYHLNCRSDGKRVNRPFGAIYRRFYTGIVERINFLREDPVWAAQDDEFRTIMAERRSLSVQVYMLGKFMHRVRNVLGAVNERERARQSPVSLADKARLRTCVPDSNREATSRTAGTTESSSRRVVLRESWLEG
ncbi:hypothetical protein BV25DRAFT_1840963 [Artomyces pyxidatus]|uniref:Uncharacterized protein n=1 Tax=Artomyces pyxidatus TaxID=48021 RepID=A0ACB8SPG8_9AGAM|nr:hypothetical protein BV25DRAFT_1840963 [Artomyces pyxidatus]